MMMLILSNTIDSVSAATQNCHLNFNESKCSVLRVSRKRNWGQYPYRLNDSPLRLVNNVNDLGIQITSTLDRNDHVYKICKKANKMLGLLRRCTLAFQNLETRRLLYITIVRTNFSPQTNYGPHKKLS